MFLQVADDNAKDLPEAGVSGTVVEAPVEKAGVSGTVVEAPVEKAAYDNASEEVITVSTWVMARDAKDNV